MMCQQFSLAPTAQSLDHLNLRGCCCATYFTFERPHRAHTQKSRIDSSNILNYRALWKGYSYLISYLSLGTTSFYRQFNLDQTDELIS